MSDDEPKRGGGGGWAAVAIGCGALGLFWMCGGPSLIALLFVPDIWGRGAPVVAPAMPADPSAPPAIVPTGTPGEGGPHLPPRPATVGSAHISVVLYAESVTGTELVAVGDACTVDVHYVRTIGVRAPPCRAEISCDGTILYGGPRHGYYPCEETPGPLGLWHGIDDAPTADDGNPRLRIWDSHVEISDDDGALGTFNVALTLPPAAPKS